MPTVARELQATAGEERGSHCVVLRPAAEQRNMHAEELVWLCLQVHGHAHVYLYFYVQPVNDYFW